MEYKVIAREDSQYPQKLVERLGEECPDKIYYSGPLELLNHFTIAVVCSDKSGGIHLMETNQLLFTMREYEMNYIGGWHSVIESEIFRLSLFRKYNTTTLFSAKGLEMETFDSFLLDRFFPPLHEFPERDEYFRRADDGELLMLSVTGPKMKRQLRKNIMERNWISCNLADIVFIPYSPRGSKTYTIAKRIVKTNIPVFTVDSNECEDLHRLGIPGFNRKTVKSFLLNNGAKIAESQNDRNITIDVRTEITNQQISFVKEPTQTILNFEKDKKDKKSSHSK